MPPKADGLILIAPAVWGRQSMPFSYRLALWTSAHTIRWKSFSGSGLKIMPSDNIEVLRANGRDPLFIKGSRSDAIYGLVKLMGDAYAVAPRLKGTRRCSISMAVAIRSSPNSRAKR